MAQDVPISPYPPRSESDLDHDVKVSKLPNSQD